MGASIYTSLICFIQRKVPNIKWIAIVGLDSSSIVGLMKWIIVHLLAVLLLAGCASGIPGEEQSQSNASTPTGALIRGELKADEYFGAITKANEQERENEQLLMNLEPTRAFNTKSGKFEYVPEGTTQKWNEETQRWEFTPITD